MKNVIKLFSILFFSLVVISTAKAQLMINNNNKVLIGSGFNGYNHLNNELEVCGKVSVIPTSFSQINDIPAVILGSYSNGVWVSPAIYGNPPKYVVTGSHPAFNGTLYLGTPCHWVNRIYTLDIHYVSLWQESKIIGLEVSTSFDGSLPLLKDVHTYKAEMSVDSATEIVRYVFDPVELQAVFPELVCTRDKCEGEGDSSGYAINYMGMVPILTKAINEQQDLIEEQQEEIDQLQGTVAQQQTEIDILQNIALAQEINLVELRNMVYQLRGILNCFCEKGKGWDINPSCCESILRGDSTLWQDTNKNKNNPLLQDEAVLFQNTPNPFSSNTEISCYVPVITTNAFIYIYNLQGVELMSFPVTQTGVSTVYVHASALPAGMYLYALVVDGVIIDTKRMILTK